MFADDDALGNQIDDGCLNCVEVVARVWPGMSWADHCSKQFNFTSRLLQKGFVGTLRP